MIFSLCGLEIWFSYFTPIAFQFHGKELVIRENDWGPTTGRHMLQVLRATHTTTVRMDSELFEESLMDAVHRATSRKPWNLPKRPVGNFNDWIVPELRMIGYYLKSAFSKKWVHGRRKRQILEEAATLNRLIGRIMKLFVIPKSVPKKNIGRDRFERLLV